MQDIETTSQKNLNTDMSPYLGSKYESPISSRSPSPNLREHAHHSAMDESIKYMSDDEISVGCPSPALMQSSPNFRQISSREGSPYSSTTTCRCPEDAEDYFKPLKKLKMVEVETDRRISPTVEVEERPDGVKSFSIVDILNHKPSKPQCNRIVRPWDIDPEVEAHQQRLESFHRQFKVQQLALLRPEFAAFNVSYTSETGSDRSSSVASDCCSPEIVPPSAQRQRQQQGKQPGATPLDALFQMTSKTFDSSAGESSADGRNLFTTNHQPKKKRKSRTSFNNIQIFELEKRFLYQKYVSPAIRDEIASTLGITNAQVITWFQNRRAKLKRDMEELKKGVDHPHLLAAQKNFLENITNFGVLKKKALANTNNTDESD